MMGFKPWISGVGGKRYTHHATTTWLENSNPFWF